MNKFPFTPAGVTALFEQLYELNDPALALEAAAMEKDLKAWAHAHFEFTKDQEVYLMALPLQVTRFLSFQGSYATVHRLPVSLIAPEASGLRESKLFETNSNLTATTLPDGSFEAGGDLVIEVSY